MFDSASSAYSSSVFVLLENLEVIRVVGGSYVMVASAGVDAALVVVVTTMMTMMMLVMMTMMPLLLSLQRRP